MNGWKVMMQNANISISFFLAILYKNKRLRILHCLRFCVFLITFVPIVQHLKMTIRTSVLWKIHTHMAKKWPGMVIYKGTFVSKQSLCTKSLNLYWIRFFVLTESYDISCLLLSGYSFYYGLYELWYIYIIQ